MSEMWGSGKVTPPALTDPVVIDGVKYRIRSIETGAHTGWIRTAFLRTSFRPAPGQDFLRTTVDVSRLTWDRVAGVWRRAP